MGDYATDVRAFIVSNFLFGADDGTLNDADSFLENGIIDSTGILEVVVWIEETYGIKIRDEELLPENFDSIYRIAGYISRKCTA